MRFIPLDLVEVMPRCMTVPPRTNVDRPAPAPWLRAGGYAGLQRVMQWNLDFMNSSDEGQKYMDLASRVDDAIQFMGAVGLNAGKFAINTHLNIFFVFFRSVD